MSSRRALKSATILLALWAVGCSAPVDETANASKPAEPAIDKPGTAKPDDPTLTAGTDTPATTGSASTTGSATPAGVEGHIGKAPPALVGEQWLNTDGNKPLSWDKLKGKVVLLDLWAFW